MPTIELGSQRVILIEDRNHVYELTLARITQKQWLRYFDSIVSTSENQGGKQVDSFDSSQARLELVYSALVDAKGYTTTEPLTAILDWKAKLPVSHRLGVANALLDVTRSESDDSEPITLGRESVYLDAVWGADEHDVMRKLHGLRHSFDTPTADQQRRYARESSRSRIVGGSRKGKTQWLGSQPALIDLYDELVVEVEGYTVNGSPLSGREEIAREMDAYHKVAAASALFAPAQPDVEEE